MLPLEVRSPSHLKEKWREIEDEDRVIERLLSYSQRDSTNNNQNNTLRFECVDIPAPNADVNDQVMLSRSRLSRIYYKKVFFPYPLSISPSVILRLGILNSIF